MLKQLRVITINQSEALRDRLKAAALRSQMLGIGICSPNNQRQSLQYRIIEIVFFDDRVKAAFWTVMAKLHIGHVERNSIFTAGYSHDLIRRNV